MTTVRILKDYAWPLMRQSPGSKGVWDGVQFIENATPSCDYTIVLNRVSSPETVECAPEHIWAVMQEPPTEFCKAMHRGASFYHRVYTQDTTLSGPRYIHSHAALPWHVNKSYDELRACSIPHKPYALSCITSTIAVLEGQRTRLRFIEKLRQHIDFELFGRGFRPIEDKWDALAPYRYSLVIENFQNPYYWSEKLADSLLAWTMPIYIGCTRVHDHFPAEVVPCLDMDDPEVSKRIRAIIMSDAWKKNLPALMHARELILDRYQLFPFLVSEIRKHERSGACVGHQPKPVTLTPFPGAFRTWGGTISHWLKNRVRPDSAPSKLPITDHIA